MKRNKIIQLKAFFLLVVFTLNILVGFACAVGLNMGFNTKHHHHEEADNTKKSATDDNCCNNDAIKFAQLDKLLDHAINTGIEAPVILVSLHFLHLSPYTQRSRQLEVARPYVESSRGIRVSIQSFQI